MLYNKIKFMKRIRFIVLLFLMMMAASVNAQDLKDVKTGSFSCKANYGAGKNSYLLDDCKVNYTYKIIIGEPVYFANMVWNRKSDFTIGKAKKTKITYAQLSEYPDLQKRFDLITPVSAKFKFTVMFYSEQSKAYIASAKSEMVLPLIDKAGSTVEMLIPTTTKWSDLFTDVVIGKQTAEKPGVVIADAALEQAFKTDRVMTGKLDPVARGTTRSLRNVFRSSNNLEMKNITMELTWDDNDFEYIIDEYNRRKASDKFLALKDTVKAEKAYYDNRSFLPVISLKDKAFWNLTIMPYEVMFENLDAAEKLYQQGKWEESQVYYKKVTDADPLFSYPAKKLEKIKKYKEYKSARNVGDLELVYVEGKGVLKSFYIGKTEITQRQWRRVMGSNPSFFKGCNECPVENVSFAEAVEFVKKLNEQTGMKYRLPKMEEWEYAAKGGVNNASAQFSGSDNLDEIAWCAYNSDESTHSVAQKSANILGIFDMTGNVSEWVSDSYDKNTRFVKGGSWSDDAINSSISSKEKYNQKIKNNRIGFRVCQDE